LIKASFELRYAGISGMAPDAENCAVCGKPLKSACSRPSEGALYCPECAKTRADLSPSALSAVRHVLNCELKKVFSFSLPEDDMKKFCEFCEHWLLSRLEKNFRTLDFIKKTVKG
jgi:DNA repair protein RecO (recombination protein O)